MKQIYNIMPIIAGICFGSAGIFVRELSENMNSTSIISSRVLLAIVLLGAWVAICHPIYFKIRLTDIWIFVGGAGAVFYTVALDHMEAGKASILCSCEPVAAMVFGVFFFGEIPTVLSITGLVIVLTALAILVLSGKKPKDAEEYDHVKR